MFQIYANRNQVPKMETDTKNQPIRHSATNEFLEFRKRVAAGTKRQKEANIDLFNVTRANEQYRQDLMEQNILIHAGMTNEYIAKLDDYYGKGKPRYFYSRAEWDAYQRNQSQTKGNTNATNTALGAQNAYANAQKNTLKENISDAYKKMTGKDKNVAYKESNSSRETAEKAGTMSSQERAANIARAKELGNDKERWSKYDTEVGQIVGKNLLKSDPRFKGLKRNEDAADYPGGPDKMYDDFEEALKKGIADYEKNAAGAAGAGAARGAAESKYAKSQRLGANQSGNSDASKAAGEAEEAWRYEQAAKKRGREAKQKEQERLSTSGGYQASKSAGEAEDEWRNNKKKSANQSGSGNAAKAAGEAEDAWRKQQDSLNKSGGYQASKSSGEAQDAWKKQQDALNKSGGYQGSKSAGEAHDEWKKEQKNINKIMNNVTRWVKYDTQYKGLKDKVFTDFMDKNGYSNLNQISNYKGGSEKFFNDFEKELKQEVKKIEAANEWDKSHSAKHSSYEDGITTEDMTPEQEYLNFRAKVEAGLKHFGQTRGLMTVPVNSALKNGELSHAGYKSSVANEYVAKLDDYYSKGKPRYFYSQAEYDAYQRNQAQKKSSSFKTNTREAAENAAKPTAAEAQTNLNKSTMNSIHNNFGNANKTTANLVTQAQNGREAAIKKSQPSWYEATNNLNKPAQIEWNNNLAKGVQNAYSNLVMPGILAENNYRQNEDYAKNAGADRAANMVSKGDESRRGREAAENASKPNDIQALMNLSKAEKSIKNNNLAKSVIDAFANAAGGVDPNKKSQYALANGYSSAAAAEGAGRDAYLKEMEQLEADRLRQYEQEVVQVAEDRTKYEEKERKITDKIMTDSKRWGKYNVYPGIMSSTLNQLMAEKGISNLDELAWYDGGPEAFFDEVEKELKEKSNNAVKYGIQYGR